MPRSRKAAALLGLFVLLAVLAPAGTASASSHSAACWPYVPDAGFADVDPAGPHKADIDCIKWFSITAQTGTFDPSGAVPRWQMALFLSRTLAIERPLPSGADQGFTDIGGLMADQQKAINQVRQLDITAGTSPTTYDPNSAVTRWQMALFLTRVVRAAGVTLPDGADQGFTDTAGPSPEAQVAINQLRQLGIAQGTSATTYAPSDLVTRQQMASFLRGTLDAIWTLGLGADPSTCNPPLPSDPNLPPTPGTVCSGFTVARPSTTFVVRPAWYALKPLSDLDRQQFVSEAVRVEVTLDGSPVTLTTKVVDLPGVVYKDFEAVFPGGLTGDHTFVVHFYDNGVLVKTHTVEVSFVEVLVIG